MLVLNWMDLAPVQVMWQVSLSCFHVSYGYLKLFPCFKKVRRWMRSFKAVCSFTNKWLFFTNMFLASKSVLYPLCIGRPLTLTSLFTVISIIRSPCFAENLSPVILPPEPFSLRSFQTDVFYIWWTSNNACWYVR